MTIIYKDDKYYAMASAYANNNNQKMCVDAVKKDFPLEDEDHLVDLWYAIDAWEDIREVINN